MFYNIGPNWKAEVENILSNHIFKNFKKRSDSNVVLV
jgi:hypothetical protein